jgi:hypothetical protein
MTAENANATVAPPATVSHVLQTALLKCGVADLHRFVQTATSIAAWQQQQQLHQQHQHK